jgi:hypothetical protein
MRAAELAPGTAVRIEVLLSRPGIGVTRVNVRRMRGVVVGPVAFEPGIVRVRVDGQVVRLLRDCLTPLDFSQDTP